MLQVYDRVLSSGSVPTLIALAAIVVILFSYYGFLDYLRARLMVRIGRRVEERFRDRVFEAVALARVASDAGRRITADQRSRHHPPVPVRAGTARLPRHAMGADLSPRHLPHALDAGLGGGGCRRCHLRSRADVGEASRTPLEENDPGDDQKPRSSATRAGATVEALHALGMLGPMQARWRSIQQLALDHHTAATTSAAGSVRCHAFCA